MRVLVFGDSLAQGAWDTKGGWTTRLAKEHGYDTYKKSGDFTLVFNMGVGGDSSRELLERIEDEIIHRDEENEETSIIIAVGTNDSRTKHGKEFMSLEEFEDNINKILNISETYAANRVLVVGAAMLNERGSTRDPNTGTGSSWANSRLRLFDNKLSQICSSRGITFIEVGEHFDTSMLNDDGLHPNDEGHAKIADLVRPELNNILTK